MTKKICPICERESCGGGIPREIVREDGVRYYTHPCENLDELFGSHKGVCINVPPPPKLMASVKELRARKEES